MPVKEGLPSTLDTYFPNVLLPHPYLVDLLRLPVLPYYPRDVPSCLGTHRVGLGGSQCPVACYCVLVHTAPVGTVSLTLDVQKCFLAVQAPSYRRKGCTDYVNPSAPAVRLALS
jgi:hypothetical protein